MPLHRQILFMTSLAVALGALAFTGCGTSNDSPTVGAAVAPPVPERKRVVRNDEAKEKDAREKLKRSHGISRVAWFEEVTDAELATALETIRKVPAANFKNLAVAGRSRAVTEVTITKGEGAMLSPAVIRESGGIRLQFPHSTSEAELKEYLVQLATR